MPPQAPPKEGMCRKQWGNIVDCTPKSPFHEEGMCWKRLGGIVVSIPKRLSYKDKRGRVDLLKTWVSLPLHLSSNVALYSFALWFSVFHSVLYHSLPCDSVCVHPVFYRFSPCDASFLYLSMSSLSAYVLSLPTWWCSGLNLMSHPLSPYYNNTFRVWKQC